MEKYYFKKDPVYSGICIETCMVKNSSVMIGSVKCQECENCIEHHITKKTSWINCKVIDKAKGE